MRRVPCLRAAARRIVHIFRTDQKAYGQSDFNRKNQGQLYYIDDTEGWQPTFFAKELKNVSPEFRQCLDDLNYQGVVEITAKVDKDNQAGVVSLVLDTASACKHR